jgi:hypothetical protein
MRDHDNLAALIDDAGDLADQFCSALPGGGAADLHLGAPVVTKVQAYRALLFCRFADQAFSAARSARHGRPASTSSLTLSAFETFTHLFELRDHLEAAFARGCLDALDALVSARLFGEQLSDPADFSMDLAGLYEAEPARATLPVADNDTDDGYDGDHDRAGLDPGACTEDRDADLALQRLMRTLIAIETSFDNVYTALEAPLERLGKLFGRYAVVRPGVRA